MEELRQKLISGLKFQGSDSTWAETANMREVEGITYIQTEGYDFMFPKGNWADIKYLISLL